MNSKKIVKIMTVLMLVATIASALGMVFASSGIDVPTASSAGYQKTGLSTTANNILGIVSYVCYAAAAIMLVVLGIKFISASPDGKAEIKKSAVIYLVGAFLVFAAGAIINIIKNVASKTASDQGEG